MERHLRETLPGGEFKSVAKVDSRRMAAIRDRGNKTTEARFRAAMIRSGLRGWRVRPESIPGKPDFFFPVESVAIFVDGCFWHGCPMCGHVPAKNSAYWQTKIERNQERDRATTRKLQSDGMLVLRFWEHELKQDLGACVESLKELLEKTRTNDEKKD